MYSVKSQCLRACNAGEMMGRAHLVKSQCLCACNAGGGINDGEGPPREIPVVSPA